ncbi:beta-lactamase family protein [Bowmanella sp. Y26]|uniref:serine hydrolase domain-containing protein n=1 Tax=Bowmanella yangjiangensis TaxID=2811230 RepID=UPI001BDC8CE8|nr:serine hydrolase domain-containing protein [Bowmanella yangjiangensis]MBT1062459.1 beta-lactamase family protein [Bowmanella yangjiangensis]
MLRSLKPLNIALLALSFPLAASQGLNEKLDGILLQTEEISPGAILYVTAPHFSYQKATGLANTKTKLAMQADFTLRTGSITKTYLAALTLLAVKQQGLELDQPATRYLPDWAKEKLPAAHHPSVRQLLNHTSGLPDYYSLWFYLFDWDKQAEITPRLVLDSIAGEDAEQAPGQAYSYSNTNYQVLALVLETVWHQPVSQILHEQLFVPYTLQHTYYSARFPPGDVIHGYGAPITPWGSALFPWVDTYEWRENSGPDGGMLATAADLDKWLRLLFSPAGALDEVGKQMQTDAIEVSARMSQGYGLEIFTSRTGVKVLGHTGAADGYLSAAFYIPATDTSLVLHMNYSDTDGFKTVLSALLKTLTDLNQQD